MLILYEGRAKVTVDGHHVAEKNNNDVVGETALQTKSKRKATVTAITKCLCLVISKVDYDEAVDLFKTLQKHKTNEILKQLKHLQGWDSMKIKAFSGILSESSFLKGQGNIIPINSIVIYNLGHASETLFIIKSGRVALDVFFEVERTLSIPVKQKEWEV